MFCILIKLNFLIIEVALLFKQFQLVGWLNGRPVIGKSLSIEKM